MSAALTWDGLGCPFCHNDGQNVDWALNAATEWLENNEVCTGVNHCRDCGRKWKEFYTLYEAEEVLPNDEPGVTVTFDPQYGTAPAAQ